MLIDTDPGGMVLVHWDEFTPLLIRLGRRATAFDLRNLGAHQSRATRTQGSGPNGSYSELLPIDTPIDWTCAELRVVQRLAAAAAGAARPQGIRIWRDALMAEYVYQLENQREAGQSPGLSLCHPRASVL